jgi:hypothetical protein
VLSRSILRREFFDNFSCVVQELKDRISIGLHNQGDPDLSVLIPETQSN